MGAEMSPKGPIAQGGRYSLRFLLVLRIYAAEYAPSWPATGNSRRAGGARISKCGPHPGVVDMILLTSMRLVRWAADAGRGRWPEGGPRLCSAQKTERRVARAELR